MPSITSRKSFRARVGSFISKKRQRDSNSAVKIVRAAEHRWSASRDDRPEDRQDQPATTEADIETAHTMSYPDDRRQQTDEEREGPPEGQIIAKSGESASTVKVPQTHQEHTAAADCNATIPYSEFHDSYDSGYMGSETLVEPPKWLNPELSTGRLILTVEEHSFWEAKGPALEVFQKLEPLVSDYLKANMGPIPGLLYCVFMTGRVKDMARPTIVFYFRDMNRRNDARCVREAIKKSGILNRYPGFKTGHSSRPKDYAKLFPQENFTYPGASSLDGTSETTIFTLKDSMCQSISGRSSSSDHSVQTQRNAPPAESQHVEHTWGETSIPGSNISQELLPNEIDYVSEETVTMWTQLTRWITDIIWPSPDGAQRLWYLCGCGRYTYIDVKELEAGGVECVRKTILKSAAAVRGRPNLPQNGNATPSPPVLTSPPPVHSVSSSTRATLPTGSTQSGATALPSLPGLPAMNLVTPSSTIARNMHLLVCVGGREFQTLAKVRHLHIGDNWNDGMLLRALLREYEEARRGQQWSMFSLIPSVPAKIKESSLAKYLCTSQMISAIRDASTWDMWRSWVPNGGLWAPLHMPSTADFVKFQVFSQAATAEPYPDQFECGQWPSSAEPYLYEPVPMRLTTLNIPLWHELKYPGPHLRHQWYNAAAKKLDGPLFDEPFPNFDSIPNIIGYGIRVNERLNEVLILWWCWVGILVTGVLVIMFAHYTGDTSSAFGLGAYLVAALTVYIQLQYAWWRRG